MNKMKKFTLIYWLHNQSKEFSDPKIYTTDDKESFDQAVAIANANGYEIEDCIIK